MQIQDILGENYILLRRGKIFFMRKKGDKI